MATLSSDSKLLVVTVSNLNAVGWVTYELALTLRGWHGKTTAETTTLEAQGYDADSLFDIVNGSATLAGDGALTLRIPPFSVVQARLYS